MYAALLVLHSLNRWLVLAALVVRLGRAVRGWRGKHAWGVVDARASRVWVTAFDLQWALGIALYCTSPLVRAAFADMGSAMKDPVLRFWSMEHWPSMVGAVLAVHIGNWRARRNPDEARKHRAVVIACLVAAVLIATAFPWPGREHVGRPWLPW